MTQEQAIGQRPRRGSSASEKQVAFAVRDQRMVEFALPDGRQKFGYIVGSDDYHWVVADPRDPGMVHLVHKSISCLSIHTRTLQSEPVAVREALEPMLSGFRGFVMKEHFATSPTP